MSDWEQVERLAQEILGADPDNVEAAGPAAKARRRRASQGRTDELQFTGERRNLTVMFVDLANSTQLADLRDPEVMHGVLRWYDVLGVGKSRLVGNLIRFVDGSAGDRGVTVPPASYHAHIGLASAAGASMGSDIASSWCPGKHQPPRRRAPEGGRQPP